MKVEFLVASSVDMQRLGERLGSLLKGGEVFILTGPLGAGKTTFVQGVARGLGVQGLVTSPSFALIHLHQGRLRLAHCDFYRLGTLDDVENLGFYDYLDEETVVFVEWGKDYLEALPEAVTELTIAQIGEVRILSVSSAAIGHENILREWMMRWQHLH